jgi:carboxymethylenebutenolidase
LRSVSSEIEITTAAGATLKGAVARPRTVGPHPGVVVIHEAFGDQPEIRAVCEKFADRDYVAVMPDLFSGGGPPALCAARMMVEASIGKAGRITASIDAARGWLAAQDDVDGERIAVIGFCMGGGFALMYVAGGRPGVRAAAVNYADVPRDRERLRAACPIVASYGGRDLVLGPRAKRLRTHLEQLGIEHDVKVYDDAGHSFMTEGEHRIGKLVFLPMRIGYAPDAAADAWERVFGFFDKHVRAG